MAEAAALPAPKQHGRSATLWVNGNHWKFILRTPKLKSNNLVENAIRPTALGKKNWLFFGDTKAGERSAVIYSIIRAAAVTVSKPTLTSAMSSPGCLP
jgi:hypothetical protein